MHNDAVVTRLTNKLGEVAQKLYQLGHEYKLTQKPHDSKVMHSIAGVIWATLTQCEVIYDDITYEEEDKPVPGFLS